MRLEERAAAAVDVQPHRPSGLTPIHEVTTGNKLTEQKTRNKSKGGKENQKKRLNKTDISSPSSFVHVSGVKASMQGFQMIDNSKDLDPRVR